MDWRQLAPFKAGVADRYFPPKSTALWTTRVSWLTENGKMGVVSVKADELRQSLPLFALIERYAR